MSVHNVIVLTAAPAGRFLEGIISGTPKPGTIVQLKSAVEMIGGRHTWEPYNRVADGNRPKGPLAVLYNNWFMGKGPEDAYVSGDRCFMYCPIMGDELKMLCSNLTGTGSGTDDAFAIGDLMIVDDGTGKLVKTTGSPQSEPFVVMETVAAIQADTLIHCMYTGY